MFSFGEKYAYIHFVQMQPKTYDYLFHATITLYTYFYMLYALCWCLSYALLYYKLYVMYSSNRAKQHNYEIKNRRDDVKYFTKFYEIFSPKMKNRKEK